MMERAIKADLALIHAAKADRWGNLTYSKTARNFNPPMAMAGNTTLAEAREIVDMIDPEEVITPGIFVDRVMKVDGPFCGQEEVSNEVMCGRYCY